MKNFRITALITIVLLFATTVGMARNYDLSGPYQSKNLSVYLVHAKSNTLQTDYLTLDEAVAANKVRIHETGSVNQLAIENLSNDKPLFVQAGELVKGGRQDRVLRSDLILPPNSGKVQIGSFCVEQGRWNKRGQEDHRQFKTAGKRMVSKELKLAAKLYKDQNRVWREVEKTQNEYSRKLNGNAKDARSSTSLQLTLENKTLENKAKDYEKSLRAIVDKKPDSVGYIYVINGEINSADIYHSPALFRKVWPNLLHANAMEALALENAKQQSAPPSLATVKSWLIQDRTPAKTDKEKLNHSTVYVTQTYQSQARFETIDSSKGNNNVIHTNIIHRTPSPQQK